MTDPVLVLRKLATLREHVERVRRRRPASAEALRADVDLQDALAMSLLVAVQEAIDLSIRFSRVRRQATWPSSGQVDSSS